ncbi:MAG: TetR/AcrR family transcriptional regulator [Sphingomonas sp.]|uniref:TetR/AcrR family transcriptional regulator n=1 Tax=Sphingomonas sp. TaxID=28214 RepID=UPI003F7E078B
MTTAPPRQTARFARRRGEILDVASNLINLHGTRGMTLTAVAQALGLDTSSVTYYFKRKDLLAAACLERTLVWLRDSAVAAAPLPDARARVRAFLHDQFERHRQQRDPRVPRLALLSDMRALDAEIRGPLDDLYAEMAQLVRGFFTAGETPERSPRAAIAAAVLIHNVHWMPAWLPHYLERDLDRAEARLFDILDRGLGARGDWPIDVAPLDPPGGGEAQTRFLHAATNLINREGYIGASVEKIAAELGVSTGSFYHHLENKDDLVVACFDRSHALLDAAQRRADALHPDGGERLAIMVSSLVALQFAGESPLLRMSAYQALPVDLRERMLQRTDQVTRHIAGTIADGIADRSIRAVDPEIAGHALIAALDAAASLRRWAEPLELTDAVGQFADVLRSGIFRP